MAKKNGDLEHVWVAAYFPKRIKKELVERTNIISSVDKILVEQVPVVMYRILGFILLGVTRIYSKKVDYLLIDSNKSLNEMKYFSEGRKKVDVNVGGMCLPESSHKSKPNVANVPESGSSSKSISSTFVQSMRAQFSSISMPENFELDAFDLEIMEDDSSDDHVKPHLELVLNDTWENDRTQDNIFGKEQGDVYARFPSDHASTSTSAMNTNINTSNSEKSLEKFRHRFSLDDCLDPMELDETDEEIVLTVIPFIQPEPECDNHNINSSTIIFEDRQNPDKQPDEECTTGQTIVAEMTSVDNIILKPTPEKRQLAVTIDVTPQSKAPVVSGVSKSDIVAVRTPAPKNEVRAPRKRKCVYEEMLKVPTEIYRDWVEDASDLICKRRKAPTALLAWKERRSFDYFSEPIIPINTGFPSDLNPVISSKEMILEEEVKETVEENQIINELQALNMDKFSEEREAEIMAPSTPVTQATLGLRFNEVHDTSRVDQVGPASSSETERLQIRDVDLNDVQMEEGPSSLGEKWSAVTKNVAGFLHDTFVNRKEKGEDDAVNLSRILKQKTKKESARFFYQILVLKTGGYINVKQEKPYDEICVMQTQKLGKVFKSGD